MTRSRAITIAGDSPYAGWDFHIQRIKHHVDRMEDLYTLALWAPATTEPTHEFDTYRYAYGWTVLNSALTAADKHTDTSMQAALDWWTEHHTTTPYQIHRILVAIDDTSWATRAEIAQRLNLDPNGLEPNTPNGNALAAADRHELITWRNLRGPHPYAALTTAGYDLIHPDDEPAGDRSQRRLAAVQLQAKPSPAAGRAFQVVGSVNAQPAPGPATTVAPAPVMTPRTRTGR